MNSSWLVSQNSAAWAFNGLALWSLVSNWYLGDSSDPGEAGLLVRLAQETLQAQEHALDIVHGAPLVTQDIEADSAREIDVGVVDGSLEEDGGRRVRVVVGESKGELHSQSFIRRLCRACDGRRPGEKVAVGVREGRDTG